MTNDWRNIFRPLIGMDIEQFVESMVNQGEEKTMERVYDYINKVEYNEEKSDCEGSTH